VVVGQKKALGLAVRNDQARKRYSGLLSSLKESIKCIPPGKSILFVGFER